MRSYKAEVISRAW